MIETEVGRRCLKANRDRMPANTGGRKDPWSLACTHPHSRLPTLDQGEKKLPVLNHSTVLFCYNNPVKLTHLRKNNNAL